MIFEKISALLAEQFGVDADSITMETTFEELGADSLDIVELTMAVEEEFGLENMDEEDLSGIAVVGDLGCTWTRQRPISMSILSLWQRSSQEDFLQGYL